MDKWDKYAKAVHRIERQYAPKFERVVLDYRLSVIQSIKEHGVQATQGRMASELVNVPVAPLLQEIYRKGGLMGARMTYREIKESVKGKKSSHHHLQIKAGGFGINETWIADVLNFLKLNLLNLASRISETMRADVLTILNEGIENGWGISQMVDRLQDRGLVRARARTIARTETVRAANVGHSIGAQSLPYEVDKVWVAAKDHRTRHSHRLVHEQKVGELDTFKVPIYRNGKPTGAFDLMQHPGDGTASAGNTINCRCRIIHEAKTDAQGNVIMRPKEPAPVVRMPDRNNVIELPQQQPLRAAFVPVKTVGEAEERIRALGIKQVNLKGLKPTQANAVLKVIEDENSFSDISKLDKVDVYRKPSQPYAALYSHSNGSLNINAAHIKDSPKESVIPYPQQLQDATTKKAELESFRDNPKYNQSQVAARINSLNNRIFDLNQKINNGEVARPYLVGGTFETAEDILTATVVHEMGHYRHITQLKEEAYFIFNKATSVSEYGRTNSKEYFAEWYAHYRIKGEIGVPESILNIFKKLERAENTLPAMQQLFR